MQKNTKEAMAYGGWRELVQIAWPLIISSGSFAILNFCDRLFLSWYSEATFRASLPAGILFFTLVCGFMALASFTNTFVAQYWGAGEKEGCSRSVAQGVLFALLSFPLILALTPVGLAVLRISGHTPEILVLEEQYLKILMWCGGGMALSSALGSFYSGRGRTMVIMVCNVGANGINILLNYLFVFGKWGFPEMGIAGAGWATVIGSWISPLVYLFLYFSRANREEYGTLRTFRFRRALFTRMIRFGLPSGIHWFLDVAAFTIFVLLIGRLGPVAHVASNIALSVNLIAFMPMVGMGMAASVVVGQYLGAERPDYAERSGWLALKIGLIYTLLVGVSFVLFPEFYLNLFGGSGDEANPEELQRVARILLLMLAVWGAGDTTGIIVSGALKGAGDTRFVMIFHSLLAWGFLVPVQVLVVLFLERGVYSSWFCTLIYIILLGLGFVMRFRSDRWKQIDLLERRRT